MRFIVFLIATLASAADFTTALGDANPYAISAVATDAAGNTYIVGSRQLGQNTVVQGSIYAPTVLNGIVYSLNPTATTFYPPTDVFVSKLDPNGKLLFTDIFAGKGNDKGTAIALDPSGNIYIAGTTTSNDFPLSKPLISQPNPTGGTGFIIKLTNDGSTILYSTYFGGTLGATSISSLATDSNGNLYLTGSTTSADFPHTKGLPFGPFSPAATIQPSGAILASMSAAGDRILYSGAIVGTTAGVPDIGLFPVVATTGAAIAVDASGNAYIGGNSILALPTTPGVLAPTGIGAFVAKVNANGTSLGYLTYIGAGVNIDEMTPTRTVANELTALQVDSAGNAYLAGATSDPKFPTTPGAHLTTFEPPPGGPGLLPLIFEGFLAKLKPDGSAMAWATYLDEGNALGPDTFVESLALDPTGNVWATGITGTTIFPNIAGVSTGPEFLVEMNNTGSGLRYQMSSPAGTVAQSVSLDPSGLVHVAGSNGFVSAVAPTTTPTMKISYFANAAGGPTTARISPAEVVAIFGLGLAPTTRAAQPTAGFYPTTLAGVQVAINGIDMPLLYVSSNQINAVVPMGIAPNTSAVVHVVNGSAVTADFPVWIAPFEPQAFPQVLNQDGTLNSASNPAKSGSIVTFYGTGWQSIFAPLADGEVASTAKDTCLGVCQGTTNFTVLYAGSAPGIIAGVTQFNVRVAAGTTSFASTVTLNIVAPVPITETVWVAP